MPPYLPHAIPRLSVRIHACALRNLTLTNTSFSPCTSIPSIKATATARAPASCSSHRNFSTTKPQSSGHAHGGPDYDPPTGWLWGIKPGEKAEKEDWENLWIYGFLGSLGLATVAYAFKPDTSIQTWALEEARRRLEAEGILKEPGAK